MTQLTMEQQRHEVTGEALLPILSVEKEKKSAPIVIQSRRTGKDYTFKISRSEWHEKWYTHIWIEQTYDHYAHMGTYYLGRIWKDKKPLITKGAKSIAWVLKHAEAEHFDFLQERVLIMHSGHCLACGKRLTDAESIKRGLGPVCASQGGLS